MPYVALKHTHQLFAIISLVLFIVRAGLALKASPALQQKWLKIVPHVIDTILIGLGFAMVAQVDMALFANGWLTAKLVGLVAYIGFGIFAIKRGKTKQIKAFAATAAVVVFLYIFGVAKAHHPLSWLQYF